MNIWIELSTVVVELLLIWYFYSGMLGKSKSPTAIKVVVALVYLGLLTCLSLLVNTSVVRSTVIILLTYFAAKLYFGKTWVSTIYPTILFFLFAIISDIICGTLLQMMGISLDELMGTGVDRLLYNTSGKFLHLLCLYIILAITNPNLDYHSIISALPLLSCQLLSIYICFHNFISIAQGNNPTYVNLETLGLLYINLVICAYVDILSRTHEAEKEAQLTKQQLEVQRNYYMDVMERQEETRSLWHDIKKYMASMEALVGSENKEEAQRCLEKIRSVFPKGATAVDTGNTLIDSILTYGMKKAEEVGVVLRPEIWVDINLAFPATDLFVIIGNTLDNAIEACCQVDDVSSRIVSISLYQKNHLLLYEIKNPYNLDAEPKPGKIHGYGLKNVRACVERDNGEMSITRENGIFDVSIHLNLAG